MPRALALQARGLTKAYRGVVAVESLELEVETGTILGLLGPNGASMWLAALRGYAGCEVLAASNWLLGRDDQVGCAVFWPVDQLEHHRTARRPA
jgi:hypothetical protein